MVDKDELKEALYRAAVAEKIADKALDIANKALVKVEAMSQSTHKAYFVNPQTGVQEHALGAPPVDAPNLDSQLDNLFESARGTLDDSVDVFSEGD